MMIKKLHHFLLLLAVVLMFGSSAQAEVYKTIIDGKSYVVDTLQHSKVGPGSLYTSIKFTGEENSLVFRTFFLTIDVENNPNLSIHCELANDSIIGVETIRGHAQKRTKSGNYYIAGTNGDFFSTQVPVGIPVYACTQNGQMATPPPAGAPHFVITDKLTPWCSTLSQSTSMKVNGGSSIPLNRINGNCYTNELVLFTPVNGNYTHTKAGGKEILIQLAEDAVWKINAPMKAKVIGEASSAGNMRMAERQGVLSADGSAIAVIDGLKVGDEIEFNLTHSLGTFGEAMPNITQTVGSNVFLVSNGVKVPQGDPARHPRTMFGHTKGQKQAIFCILDGRSSISSGGTYAEMSDIMIYAGADYAVNGDGGGSSTLYLQNLGIQNRPSDGVERSDGNGMYVILSAPEDNEIASISFMDWTMDFPKHGVYKPVFYGYNKYGMLIDNNVQGVTLSCPAELGFIENGSTFIGSGDGTYALTGTYNGMTASIPVTVKESDKVAMRHLKVINDTHREYPVEVEAMMNETMMPISPAALKWSTDDASLVTIDPNTGVLKGMANGETAVHGTVGTFNGSMQVVVEKPTARAMAIEPNLDPSTWIISQKGGDKINAEPMENGMKITYTGNSSSRGANIKLAKRIKVWSLPDAIRLRINPGDAPINSIKISASANEGGVISTDLGALVANQMNELDLPTDKWCDTKDMASYPIYINNIYLGMGASTVGKEYTIEIPGFEAIYNAVDPGGVENITTDNSMEIYPNPVKSGENANISVTADANVSVSLFNVSGQKVKSFDATPVGGHVTLSTVGLMPAVYFVTVTQSGVTHNGKIVVE